MPFDHPDEFLGLLHTDLGFPFDVDGEVDRKRHASYRRQRVITVWNGNYWTNENDIRFPEATTAWGIVQCFGFFDHEFSGTCLGRGPAVGYDQFGQALPILVEVGHDVHAPPNSLILRRPPVELPTNYKLLNFSTTSWAFIPTTGQYELTLNHGLGTAQPRCWFKNILGGILTPLYMPIDANTVKVFAPSQPDSRFEGSVVIFVADDPTAASSLEIFFNGLLQGTVESLNFTGPQVEVSLNGTQATVQIPPTPFVVANFSTTTPSFEMGRTANELTFSWAAAGAAPTRIVLKSAGLVDREIPIGSGSFTWTGLTLTDDTTFTIRMESDSKVAEATLKVDFQPRVYYGTSSDPHLTDPSGLSSALKVVVAGNYTYPKGAPYYYFLTPSQFPANGFMHGQFEFSMQPIYTIDVGGINYNVYRSTHELTGYTGAITLIVS